MIDLADDLGFLGSSDQAATTLYKPRRAVVEGPDAIVAWRAMMGATNPVTAAPGTIRGDLATVMQENVTHGSDSPESAAREVALFFPALA
jgi:nucleoside diphosphate kinase